MKRRLESVSERKRIGLLRFSFYGKYASIQIVRQSPYSGCMLSADGDSAPFSGADPDAVGEVENEDFSVTDLAFAGFGPLENGRDGRLHEILVYSDVQPDLPEEPADLLRPQGAPRVETEPPEPEQGCTENGEGEIMWPEGLLLITAPLA